ncbi:MAG: peptide deformylase [Oscillospiraceae bacterium]|jgi:peptide deformylase|nr:peptide deformylase [Oscillospiraceae bacterium]
MALRNILLQSEPALRKISKKVKEFDAKLWSLLDDMHETLKYSGGVGLAANQVGILRNIFVLHNNGKQQEFINPQIIKTEGESIAVEGCLSCPEESGKVKRPQSIELQAWDRNGREFTVTLHDLDARIACHETDHLVGRLFKDIAIE